MSGSTIGGFAGGAIGFFVGGPQGAQWGFMIGSTIGGYVDPVQVEGPRLTDAQAQLSNEGVPRPIIYGTACVAGNIIQVGPLVEHKKTQRAGKGGPEQTTYTYTRTVAIRICEAAPLGGTMRLVRVWKDDKLVADFSEANTIPADTAAFESILTFYTGAEDQLPDPSLEALPEENGGGVGNVPAYRGTCYAVLTDLDCTERGGAVSQFRWEVASDATEEPVVDSGLEAGRRSRFANSHWPLLDSESDYTYTAYWLVPTGGGITRQTFNTIEEALDYIAGFADTVASALGVSAKPSHYCGYSANTDGDMGSITDGLRRFDLISEQPDATDYETLVLLYQWIRPDQITWHNLPRNDSFFSSLPVGEYHGTRNGVLVINRPPILSVYPACIRVNRKRVAPPAVPVGSIPIPDKPGWYVSPDGESIIEAKTYTEVSGTYKVLAEGALTGSNPNRKYSFYEQGPVRQSGDPEYSSSAFWSAAYSEAVAAGTMPAGMSYNSSGTGSASSTYPQVVGSVFDRGATETKLVTPGTVPLGDIVTDLCGRAGIAADQVDVTALAGITVRGFPVARQTSAAEAIRALQQVFLFDFPEWGDGGEVQTKLRAVLRGGATVLALTEDDLVDTDEDDETRGQQVEFPRKLSVTASDPEANYEPVTEAAERESENIKAVGEQQVSTAVVLTRDEIKQLADKLLKVLWEQATGRKKVEVPEEFSIYTPSDRLTYGGKTYRIDRVELLDGSSKWDLTRDRAGAYTSSATGGTPLTPTAPVSSIRGPTMFAAMNLPRLRSQDTTPGMYVAVCGLLPGWAGCDLYLSTDDGVTEQLVATILDASTMGVLTADLSAAGSPLSVSLYDGELDSATVDQLLARHNAAAVTTDEVSEIVQFQTATETDTKAYDLTDLSRGVLGTTPDDHVEGDSFVALDAVTFLPLDIALAGKTLIFRPVSRGTVPANNATYSVQFKPQFTGPQVVEAYTDDAGNVYTDDDGNTYYYEVPPT